VHRQQRLAPSVMTTRGRGRKSPDRANAHDTLEETVAGGGSPLSPSLGPRARGDCLPYLFV
jgi:hypothetical protein